MADMATAQPGGKGVAMEEEGEEVEVAMPMAGMPQVQPMSQVMAATAFSIAGEVLLVVGILFILLGTAAFITDFLKIKGSGEALVGVFLCIVAMVLVLRARQVVPKIEMRMQPQGPGMAQVPPMPQPKAPDSSGSYR